MIRHKSAQKPVRQAEKRRKRNVVYRSRVKTFTKQVNKRLKNGDKEKTQEVLKTLTSALDKAVQKGIIHKNTAARKKSRITKKVNELLLQTHTTSQSEVPGSRDDIASPVT